MFTVDPDLGKFKMKIVSGEKEKFPPNDLNILSSTFLTTDNS